MEGTSEQELIAVDLRLPRAVLRSLMLDDRENEAPASKDKVAYANFLISRHHRWAGSWGGLPISGPCLNILLELYLAHHAGRKSDISSLSIASGAPFSSGLRHVGTLVSMGLVRRCIDPGDRRRSFIVIADDCFVKFEAWLDLEVLHLQKGLPAKVPPCGGR